MPRVLNCCWGLSGSYGISRDRLIWEISEESLSSSLATISLDDNVLRLRLSFNSGPMDSTARLLSVSLKRLMGEFKRELPPESQS
ncbi:MAG: hypothetical protein ACI814_004766 [Mariniblastus sp.]|jgi:hypothetical protein